jgi:hypothetical protein
MCQYADPVVGRGVHVAMGVDPGVDKPLGQGVQVSTRHWVNGSRIPGVNKPLGHWVKRARGKQAQEQGVMDQETGSNNCGRVQ